MAELRPGLYEVLITEGLRAQLDEVAGQLPVSERHLQGGDVADRIAWHVSKQVERALLDVPDERRVETGLRVARALIERLAELESLNAELAERPAAPASILHAVSRRRPDGSVAEFDVPLIPLLDTTLLTSAPGEPTLWSQLRSEIDSADEIDVVMAFIRRSGINPLLDPLRRHCEDGRPLRVLTTTYTGSHGTAGRSTVSPTSVPRCVSHTTSARHGCTRRRGSSTVSPASRPPIVGSSNLTHSAQVTGLEWNVRVSAARNPDVLAKFGAVFESYWAGDDFVPYDPDQFDAEHHRAGGGDRGPHVILSPIELRPWPFQERLLELIELSRQRGHHRNLLSLRPAPARP